MRLSRSNNPVLKAVAEVLESRRLLCTSHLEYLPEAPKWSDAIEAEARAARAAEGGPEAVSIVWTNRGQASDNFAAAFGTSAEAGRQVVDAAIAAWSRVITSFNRSDGTSSLQVSISIARDGSNNLVGGFGGAGGPAAAAPSDGKPRTGSITLNAGTINGNANDSNGWFFDTTPNDWSEFEGTIFNPFTGDRGTAVGSDFYSVVAAELTHVLGFISPKAGGAGSNFNGYRLISSGFTQATGQRDNAEGGGTSGYFYVFNGPSVSHAMTGYNSGDPDDDSWGNIIHTAGGSANFTHNAVNYRGTDDDGNASYGSERTLPSWVTANILKDAYGYSIENPAKFGTMLASLNQSTGRLTVRGIDSSADTVYITSNGATTTVSVDLGNDFPGSGFRAGTGNLDAWVSEFPTGSVQSISIDAGSGDDFVILDLPGGVPVTVNGGAGTDQIIVKGSTGYDGIVVNSPTIQSTSLNVQSYSNIEQLRIDTRTGNADLYLPNVGSSINAVTVQGDSGNEVINLHTLESSTPATFFMGSGNDTVNVQVDGGVGLVASPVTINGFDGDDTVNIGPVDFAGTIVTQPITFNGDNDNDTLNLGSNNADSVRATMTFNGGSGINDRIVFNDQAPSYNLDYDVRPTFVNRVGFSNYNVNYTQTDRITINGGSGADSVIVRNGVAPIIEAFGNDGNDNFTRGDGIITASSVANFNGGNGVDQITFDDHLNTGNIIFDCRQGEIFYGGLITQFTTGFESVGILAGSGSNEITFVQTLTQNFNIDAGPGNDTIILGFQGTATIQGVVTVNGGDDSDTFQINAVNTSGAGSISLNGGNGLNSMAVNRPGTLVYDVGSFLNMYSFGSSALITIGNIESASISGNSLSETFNLYSASSLFGLFQIFGNSGDDAFYCLPVDSGNYSFDNLQLNGGAGTDSFQYVGTPMTGPQAFNFAGNFLSIPRGIVSDDIAVGSAIENVTVTGGSGDDSFNVNQYSAGGNLLFRGGSGNDSLNLGNGNLQANLTNAASFNYDGQDGYDSFTIANTGNANAWTYTFGAASVTSQTNFPATAYTWVAGIANMEAVTVNAGSAADIFRLNAIPAGLSAYLNGGNGDDALNYTVDPSLILGTVYFYGDGGARLAGNNLISNLSNSSSTPRIVHITGDSIGAFPGDTYWGPGGGLYYTGVTTVLLTMGTGDDAVFAVPSPTTAISVRGGIGNDSLYFATAAAGSYQVNPGSFGTFDLVTQNALRVNFLGFEDGPYFDESAPEALSGEFAYDVPQQTITFVFSEDVSQAFSPAYVVAVNLDTVEQVPYGYMASSFDTGTLNGTIQFPGYPGGALPDGNYYATLVPGIPDAFGNLSTTQVDLPFFVFAGDANHDRAVNLDDFTALASKFGESASFSQGDFDYSGTVDLDDFTLLASKFGTTLPDPPATSSQPSRLATAPRPGVFATRPIAVWLTEDLDVAETEVLTV